MDWIALLGRVLMGAIFIQGGINKALAPAATMAGFARQGLPLLPAAYGLTLAVEIGAATLFVLGWKTRWAALALALWCVATALIAHYHPGDRNQMIHFMKNICMAGGFLQVLAFGAGRFGLDRR